MNFRTPYAIKTSNRCLIILSDEDTEKVKSLPETRKSFRDVTDLLTGKEVRYRREDCGASCFCDASIEDLSVSRPGFPSQETLDYFESLNTNLKEAYSVYVSYTKGKRDGYDEQMKDPR